jgi:aryl-alcohol dehydrogenase-like predicted oxidoreductase
MEQRALGTSGIGVSAIGLGLMSMSGVYGPGDDEESIRVIHRALELGITLLDSSDMYGWGHNEQLLGRALRGRRQGVIPPADPTPSTAARNTCARHAMRACSGSAST